MTTVASSSSAPAPRTLSSWMCYLVPLLLGFLAITSDSFWIDECVTAEYVSQPTFSEWRHDLQTTNFAEAQMPLYLFYLWCWEKLFGSGEWSLRMAALPWFVAGIGLFLNALRRVVQRGWIPVAVAVSSAFIWYYLNEARLYAMQLGAACAVVASLVALAHLNEWTRAGQRRWFVVFLLSVMLLSGISIIGMLWAGAATLALGSVLLPAELWNRIKCSPVMTLVWVCVLSVLAGYYLLSVLRGARASSLATTNLQTVVYVGYELLGFTGLGPGRDALREQGIHALKGHLPWLGVYSMSVGVVLGAGVISIWNSRWRMRALWMGGFVSLPAMFLLVTGVTRHFRVLGRHFTPLLAVILLLLVLGVAWLWGRGRAGRAVVVLYLVLAMYSSAQVRLSVRHQKDDYRDAAEFGRQALVEGKRIWWAAAPQGADYYGLLLTDDARETGRAYAIFGQSLEDLNALDLPEVVVESRPDIYDFQGGLAAVLRRGGYSNHTNYSGFTVWVRQH